MKKIICLLIIMMLVIVVLTATGCETSDVKSDEEAAAKVGELGEDISNVGSTLDDIDEGLSEES